MSIVLPVALPEFEFGIAEQRRKAKTEAERSMDHGHHEHANGLTKHCRVEQHLHTCTFGVLGSYHF